RARCGRPPRVVGLKDVPQPLLVHRLSFKFKNLCRFSRNVPYEAHYGKTVAGSMPTKTCAGLLSASSRKPSMFPQEGRRIRPNRRRGHLYKMKSRGKREIRCECREACYYPESFERKTS